MPNSATARTTGAALAALLLSSFGASQTVWSQALAPTSPPPRTLHALAYDAARQQVVLFGGLLWGGNDGETWTWDGSTWTHRPLVSRPSPRIEPAMAYDSFRARVVMFGGVDARGWTNETWEWDGAQWSLRMVPGPQPNRRCCLAYDSARRRTVMHFRDETWEYDGTQWTQMTPATKPPARDLQAIAYDAARARVVLFGGNGLSTIFGDTWEWDGANWTLRNPATSPSPRQWHALAYDTQRGVVVLFGGIGPQSSFDETWVWNGSTWQQQLGGMPPQARSMTALAYDAARDEVILFAGEPGGTPLGDTWRKTRTPMTPPSWSAVGTGCTGSAGTPGLEPAFGSLPWLGQTFSLLARPLPTATTTLPFGLLGGSTSRWGASPLPLDLGPIGMPGCALLTSADLIVSLANLGGHAEWRIPIPAASTLLGQAFAAQTLVTDPGANLLGIVVSNAGRATIR